MAPYASSSKILAWMSDNNLDEEYNNFVVSMPDNRPVPVCLLLFYQSKMSDALKM